MNDQNFFSIDRLVEFGMSVAIAQQMVQSMNQSMRNMFVPGSIQSMPQPVPSIYYVVIDGQQHFPFQPVILRLRFLVQLHGYIAHDEIGKV